jgi:hypothetical protein
LHAGIDIVLRLDIGLVQIGRNAVALHRRHVAQESGREETASFIDLSSKAPSGRARGAELLASIFLPLVMVEHSAVSVRKALSVGLQALLGFEKNA